MSSSETMQERSLSVETERIVAWLRLPAIGLLLFFRTLPHPNPEREWFYVSLGLFAAWSIAAVMWTAGRPVVGDGFAVLATVLDIGFFTVLTTLSGGPFSNVRFAYIVVPVVVAFRMRPRFTALAAGAVAAAYVTQALAHPSVSDPDVGRFIGAFALFLLWTGSACVLLSVLLARRTRAVTDLLAIRTVLLAQVLSSEERERRVLSEALHDGAVQNLLVARQDMNEVEGGDGDAVALAGARIALDATLDDLRSAIYELHPYVLDEVGLAAAVRRTAEHAAARAELQLDLELDSPPRASNDTLLYSVARELTTNVVRHARAGRLTVGLRAEGGWRTLVVEDDGRGLEPARASARLAEGHIGLASQRARIEAAGGTFQIVARPGRGTRIEVRVPAGSAVG